MSLGTEALLTGICAIFAACYGILLLSGKMP